MSESERYAVIVEQNSKLITLKDKTEIKITEVESVTCVTFKFTQNL